MGKTSRKTKQKKSDFNKVKLKVGKKKPQKINATVTSFKSQSIYISEQLKTSNQNDSLACSNLNLNDLLSHLNHHSPTFRLRALTGIKKIFSNYSSNITLDLASILKRTPKCLCDDDSDVRNACISVLYHIATVLPQMNITPFFPLLLSHLYCAMTHLSADVQRDSLKVVDLYLKYYPDLIRGHGNIKLLQHFIEMISIKEGGRSNEGRVLDMKLSVKKESAIHWRINVLSRIQLLLEVSPKLKASDETIEPKRVQFDSSKIGFLLLRREPEEQGLLLRKCQLSNVRKSMSVDPSKDLMMSIIPVLLQSWVEVSDGGFLAKEAESLQTMKLVLSLTFLCSERCLNSDSEDKIFLAKWLKRTFLPSFVKYFFSNFPIQRQEIQEQSHHVENKRSRKKTGSRKDEDVLMANVLICHLFTLLASSNLFEEGDPMFASSTKFLTHLLSSFTSLTASTSEECFDTVLSCVKRLMHQSIPKDNEELITSLYGYCCNEKCTRSRQVKILHFLSEELGKLQILSEQSTMQKFFNNLPSHFILVLYEISQRKNSSCKMNPDLKDFLSRSCSCIVKCMQNAIGRRNREFLSSFSEQLSKIINLFNELHEYLFCPDLQCEDCERFQCSTIVFPLFYIDNLSSDNVVALSRLCNKEHISYNVVTSFVQVLEHRLDPYLSDADVVKKRKGELNLLLKFLFSTLLCTHNESEVGSVVTKIELNKHCKICDFVCQTFKRYSKDVPHLWKVLTEFLSKKVQQYLDNDSRKIVLGIVKLGQLICKEEPSTMDFSSFGRYLSTILRRDCCEVNVGLDEEIMKCVLKSLHCPSVFEHCLMSLTATESVESTVALTKLFRINELQEKCIEHSSTVLEYVRSLEKSETSDSDSTRKLKVLSSLLASTNLE